MSKKYSGKPFKDSSSMKKSKLSFLEKRKLKREKKKNKVQQKNYKYLGKVPEASGMIKFGLVTEYVSQPPGGTTNV